MLEKIQETAAFLKAKMHTHPETAIILGTGLGSLVHEITDKYEINYSEIPNFPVSTVEGHSGKLIFGKLGNKDIMAMQGRFHFYEGYSYEGSDFPRTRRCVSWASRPSSYRMLQEVPTPTLKSVT